VRVKVVVLALLLADLLVGLCTLGVAFGGSLAASGGRLPVSGFADVVLIGVVPSLLLWVLLRFMLGLYPGYGLDPAQELRLQTSSSVLTLVVMSVALFALGMGGVFLRLLPLGIFGLVLATPIVRAGTKQALRRTGLWGRPVVVLGEYEMARRLVRTMVGGREQGLRPVALFSDADEDDGPRPEVSDGVPYLGGLESAPLFAQASGINTAILAVRGLQRARTDELADWVSTNFQRVIVVPSLAGLTTSAIAARDLSGVLGVEVKHNLLDPHARRVKRMLDLALVITGGTFVLPLLLFLALLVRLESRGPVFYSDRRLGRNAKPFHCLKFRTMVPDAEEVLNRILAEDAEKREEYSKYHKLRDDPRITRIGRFLRKTSLDELPQLWNVLKGEMSLVGPRPYLPRESPEIGSAQREILRVYPGMTGPWQVSGRSDMSFKERNQMDSYYVRNWSVWLDLIILSRTVVTVLRRRGAV
jgi:Undecaprenyl-phosphate galactose phosphotransferase WbaP